jgi:hypothetical protein
MPPAQALAASQHFSDLRLPALNPIYVALSFSFVLICGGFLARRYISRRRRPIHNSAPRFTNFGSTLGRSLSWGWATVRLVRVVAPSSATPIQQSFAGIVSPIASSCVRLSNSDGSRGGRVISLFRTLRRPHATRILRLLPSLRQQPIGSNDHTGSPWHLSDIEDSVTDKDEPEPDIRVPDSIIVPHILRSIHNDAEWKTEIPVIPLIILSLPSSDRLVGDPPRPVHQDEHLLSPDGTFRSTGPRARITASTHDVSDATRLALASRLRERRKRAVLITSPNVLATPSMAHWPRWF